MSKFSRWPRLIGVLVFTLFFLAAGVLLIKSSLPGRTALAAAPAARAAQQRTLPPPWLSDDDVVDAPYGVPNVWPPPAVDGYIGPGEYAGAGKVTFPGYEGDIEVFFRQDTVNLYVAFELPDKVNKNPWPDVSLYLDTNNDGGTAPQPGDFRFLVWRNNAAAEWQGTGTGWNPNPTITWTYGLTETMSGWSAEFGIPFTKLGITNKTTQTLGLALSNGGPGPTYLWPSGADAGVPDTWGSLVSSSEWSTFYWKPGPWEDYAPSGLPDFDQKQPGWVHPSMPISTHCGPVAMANSLWWFDTKFETPDHAPPTYSDTYRLVTSYGGWDDHDPANVGGMGAFGLVDDLANNYFNTNDVQGVGAWAGTYVTDMYTGTLQYLRDHGLWDDYLVTLVISPSFEWVASEVQRSEDVVLLLGFYEDIDPDPTVESWVRVGGHYVTVAGVDLPQRQIAFSDPYVDAFENGLAPLGRVHSGTLLLPHVPGHTSEVHNDAGNISHDVYVVTDTNSPGGTWGPEEYPLILFEPWLMAGPINPHPFTETYPWAGNPIQVEVEFALAVSPFTWKASGEWLPEEDPMFGLWQPWQDYAPNGVPDFDQRQDNWRGPPFGSWTFCGPVAAANSLWWFDTKFEPFPVGPPQPPPLQPPIPYNDNYPLLQTYDPGGLWDDHDPLNVDDLNTPWPPASGGPPIVPGEGEFVEDLALYFDTDGVASGMIHGGTIITDMYTGIDNYIINHGLRQGYVITMVKRPDFWWIAEEVEVSEDVILLLGFWENQGDWVRLGGHYVTVPGIDKQGGFVAFSDPFFDRIEQTWPYAGIGSVVGWPSYMGRTGDGWLISHPIAHTGIYTTHNDAGNLSHDVYNVQGTDSPGGIWGPEEYIDLWAGDIENFWGQNNQEDTPTPTGGPVQAEVDWAIAVSPVADVWITKDVTPTALLPGDWLTFTLAFTNVGSLPAEDVIITDYLDARLVNPKWEEWLSNGLTVSARAGVTYAWDLPDLAWMEWGLITVTAQVDPNTTWAGETSITNTAWITTTSVEQYQLPEMPDVASASFVVQTSDAWVSKSVTPTSLYRGDWLTYTIQFGVDGPYPTTNAVITDLLHTWLVSPSVAGTWNDYGGSIVAHDTYTWTANSVPAGGQGLITVTARVSPALMSAGLLDNDVAIAVDTFDRNATNDTDSASTTVLYSYDLSLTPDADQAYGSNGDTVVYTFTLQNTGNASDSYDLSLAGDDWSTISSTHQVGPLNPGLSATVQVSVEVPGTALGSTFDQASITAQSVASATLSDTSTFTTTAIDNYAMHLDPASAALIENPGKTVTYTLTLYNDGNITDTYNLTHTQAAWTTTLSTPTAGPVAPWDDVSFEVYVTLPSTATNGAQEVMTVTAASTGAPAVTDASLLTTTATTQVITRDVALAPPAAAQTGVAGTSVTYTLRVTNTGSLADSVALTATGSWTTTLSDNGLNLNSGQGATVYAYVQVPSGGVSDGDQDVATVTARSNGDPSQTASAVLTTTAFVATYGVDLQPPVAGTSGNPGDVVTYTLTLHNTGNSSDSYDVTGSVSGQNWHTLWPTTVGPVASGDSAQLQVTVEILSTASDGQQSQATITATSQSDAARWDTSLLTTTATTQVITRGVALAPPAAAQTGEAGATVTYTLRVTNTGSLADGIDLSVAGSSWHTTLSDASLFLHSGQGATVYAYVQVPSGGVSDGDQDVATVTARSTNDPAKRASAVLTTTARVPTYGVDLQPPVAGTSGNPGDVVTYTLTLHNTGDTGDNYTVASGVTGQAWTTTAPATVGPVAGGGSAQFNVTVQIAAGASDGQQSQAVITATSGGDSARWDTSVLTTLATTQTITRGVQIAALAPAGQGDPGATVTYTLRVTNTGNVADSIQLALDATHAWTTTLSATSLGLNGGQGTTVYAYVRVPSGAASGDKDDVTVTARSSNDASASDDVTLTTTAGRGNLLYLPLVLKDH